MYIFRKECAFEATMYRLQATYTKWRNCKESFTRMANKLNESKCSFVLQDGCSRGEQEVGRDER